jgi:diacylglycerol kinase
VKRAENLRESFRYAFSGLRYAFVTQRNLRLHFSTAAAVMILGWILNLPKREFIVVLAAIMVVMVAEMMNTAVEAVVDLASPDIHPLAQTAKDVAAGAVLLAAIGAASLGLWVFVPRLSAFGREFMIRWDNERGLTIILLLVLAGILAAVIWIPRTWHKDGYPTSEDH